MTFCKYFLFLSLCFTFKTFAISDAKESFLFLDHDQFLQMTSLEQRKYIDEIRHLVLNFEQQNDMAPRSALKQKILLFLATFAENAYAQPSVTSSRESSSDVREENAKISVMFDFLNAEIKAANDHPSTTLRQHAKESFVSVYARMQKLSQNNLNPEQQVIFNKNVNSLKERHAAIVSLSPELQSMKADISRLTKSSSSLTQPAVKKDPSGVPLPGYKKALGTSSVAAPVMAVTKDSPVCLYAGFVLTSTTGCHAKTLLFDDQRLQELAKSEFKCKSSNEILCNPIVFGFQSDLSPYCTTRSKTASKNCQDISNNSDNHARLHLAWKNTANKKVFEDYQNSLKELCDSSPKSEDVRATCKVVVAQFNEKVKKEFPAILAQTKSDPESKTDKSSKKN